MCVLTHGNTDSVNTKMNEAELIAAQQLRMAGKWTASERAIRSIFRANALLLRRLAMTSHG